MTGPVRSVSLAFTLMRVLAAADGPQSLTDLARTTATSPSSCLNLLRTLLAEGIIEADRTKRYCLTPAWLGLTRLSQGADARMIALARPLMAQLARDQSATVGLWRRGARDRLELIALGESEAATRIHMVIGQRQPFGGGATGRALAAASETSEAELAQCFAALRWQRPLDFPTYAAQVAEVRSAGYAIDDGYGHAGVCSIACLIPGAVPEFCLSTSVFQGSRDVEGLRRLGEESRRIAADIGAASPV